MFSFFSLDCFQLGFLPRNIAKWVSPLWDIGFFGFSGFVYRDEVLAAASGGVSKKVQLMLHVSKAWYFSFSKCFPEFSVYTFMDVILMCCVGAALSCSIKYDETATCHCIKLSHCFNSEM